MTESKPDVLTNPELWDEVEETASDLLMKIDMAIDYEIKREFFNELLLECRGWIWKYSHALKPLN